MLGGIVLLTVQPPNRLTAQDYRAQAIRILRTVPLIDGHNDLADAIRERGGLDSVDLAVSQPKLMTDIPRLRGGRVGGQFWAAYVPVTTMDSGPHPAVYALEQIDLIQRFCARNARAMAMATTAAAVERNFAAGKISCLIGIEGGHAIENSLGALRMFARLGVRYMTLTHWRTLQTMSDAIHTSRAPVIFSHSSARALANHARDVPDSILKLVAGNRGVVMVNFNPGFVSEAVRTYEDSMTAWSRALREAGADSATRTDSMRAWEARAPHATLAQAADHIEHIRQVAGIDCVGIGSDFDGITEVPVGLEDVSKFPDLIAELLRRGWTEADVKKVAGLNTLRVMREAERVAVEMRRTRR
ncbi:MAG: membrane dipeptidase [Gemmatimonadetes bacterium]|nr:MAG: membrane dipeptidase [Gemmatimonadota bacterium]